MIYGTAAEYIKGWPPVPVSCAQWGVRVVVRATITINVCSIAWSVVHVHAHTHHEDSISLSHCFSHRQWIVASLDRWFTADYSTDAKANNFKLHKLAVEPACFPWGSAVISFIDIWITRRLERRDVFTETTGPMKCFFFILKAKKWKSSCKEDFFLTFITGDLMRRKSKSGLTA